MRLIASGAGRPARRRHLGTFRAVVLQLTGNTGYCPQARPAMACEGLSNLSSPPLFFVLATQRCISQAPINEAKQVVNQNKQ